MAVDMIARGMIDSAQIPALKDSLYTQTSVNAVNNIYTLDFLNTSIKNFSIETTDTVAKSISFSNVPTGFVQATVKLKYTNTSTITYPASVVWKDGNIPVYTATKTYLLMFVTYDGGTTWLSSYVGAW